MKVLIFDVETTGLPPRHSYYKRYPDPQKDYESYNGARMIELAYTVYTTNEERDEPTFVRSTSCLIKPDNVFEIRNTFIHGITQDAAETNGDDVRNVLQEFVRVVNNVDIIVAHNLEFDFNIVLAECYRQDIDPSVLYHKTKVCTMKFAKRVLELDRWPKLTDLYKKLYPQESKWEQRHRALDDAEKCAACYFALVQTHQ